MLAAGTMLDPAIGPAERVKFETFAVYFDAMRRAGKVDSTFKSMLFYLRTALRIKVPKQDFDWITHPDGCALDSIPWLRFIRERSGAKVHFWPFDGWEIPAGGSAVVEVYPALWSFGFANDGRTGDQHDAFSIAAWLSAADGEGRLAPFLRPSLAPSDLAAAQVEGWILGV